jgi:hypothetical protein
MAAPVFVREVHGRWRETPYERPEVTMTVRACLWTALAMFPAAPALAAQSAASPWTIEPTPLLTIGESQADTNDMFSQVVGATRLPDGRVLVGDIGSYALRLFAADGKFVRRFGRKGDGPGEIGYLKSLLRCGDSVVTVDVSGRRVSMFSLGGNYVRSFRFSSPQAGRPAYVSVCNAGGDFAHYGWELITDVKGGVYRSNVPLWISKANDAENRPLAVIPGSERFGQVLDGKVRGSRPLPLGKQTAIALGNGRVYVATGDRYEIAVFDFAGKPLTPIREDRPPQATSKADIDFFKEREFSMMPAARRELAERAFDDLPLPKTLPSYAVLVVDARGHVWAQDYPRGAAATATWNVYDAAGKRVASVELPRNLEVYEIGTDYVLGRFLDPDESIPLVRIYRLRRGT